MFLLRQRRPVLCRRPLRILSFLLAILPILSVRANAQLPPRLSQGAVVSLVTFSPGKPVHALFGHGAFRVVDPAFGLDILFNYGTFDFDDEFVPKFMYGELDYYLSVVGTKGSLEQAIEMERSVIEQVFDLDAEQRQTLYGTLVKNAHPDNRVYRYDFLFDNCSTRVIDMLRATLDGSPGNELVMPTGPYDGRSFRVLLGEHVAAKTWLDFGFDLLLGSTVDREATFEEAWFLPIHLMNALDTATLSGRPLVSKTNVLLGQAGEGLPPRAFDQPAALAWLLLALVIVLFRRDTGGPWSRRFDGALFGLAGLAGLFIALMWFGTLHHVTTANWDLLWAWPTHLLAAIFLLKQTRPNWMRIYLGLAAISALVVALGIGLSLQFAPAILPLGLVFVVRCARNLRPQRAQTTSDSE